MPAVNVETSSSPWGLVEYPLRRCVESWGQVKASMALAAAAVSDVGPVAGGDALHRTHDRRGLPRRGVNEHGGLLWGAQDGRRRKCSIEAGGSAVGAKV